MNASDENRRLRRTVRDLVALSTLPAVWIGLGPDRIASSLADVLLDTLSLDLIYVRLAALNGEGVVEFVRRKNRSDELPVDVARAAFAPLLTTDQTESSVLISDPFDGGPLHVTVIRFGDNDDQGVLVSGSCNPDFPTERDRALLGLGANQAAIVLQRRRAEEQVQQERERLRVTLASIGDAVIATDTQGRVTYLNAVAEELTGWTAEDAEGEPLETVFPILNENTRLPVDNPAERVLREGVVVGLANHTILIAKDGTERPIHDSAAPIRDAAGKMLGVVLIFRDVTEQRRAKRELSESEARKSAILETALDCIISMDHEGKVFDFNSAAERTFGYSRGDVIGRELADLIIPPSLRERHQQGMAHYLATGEGPVLGKRLELPALHADGSEFPVELAITRILTDGPPLFTAYLRDISERTKAEQYRNARLGVTQVLNQASDVREGASGVLRVVCESLAWEVGFFWIVNKGGDGIECHQSWHKPELPVIEFEAASFSRAFKKGEGLPGHVWSTGKCRWLIDVSRDANFPRAASAAKYDLHSAFACLVAVGDRILGVIEFFTKRIHEPDADLLEMMGTVAASLGQFIERTAAEAAVRQSEQELADFFENATVGLHWVGPDGTILRANKAELDLLGYSREEYVGRHIADFHADEDVICDILKKLKAGEQLEEYPARLRCKDGSIKEVLIDSSVLWKDGQFVHTRCFTRDVTEAKRAEKELREADRRKDEFLATLAHELRNPLAPIRNALEILKMPRVDSQTVERSREMMERQVQYLVRLVDDLLDVSRVMRGKIELRREKVELATIVARAVETVQPLVDAQGHHLNVRMSSDTLLLDADPVRLAQVVGNLLTNAVKYMEPNGRIWLTGEREGEMAVLRVRDTGIGIGAEILPRIFELFVQVDHASTKAQGGLGIGLTLVKNLVEMHNGIVHCHSDGLGHGSEFVVRLPLVEQTVEQDYSSDTAGPAYRFPPPSGKRLLVVDDNQDAANSLAMLLKLQRHEVRVAYSGMAALEMIKTYTPEVVLLDIGMPGMDGYEVARRIRQTPGMGNVVLAALTGWGQQEDRRRTAEAGFDHHLVKPLEPEVLEKLLAK